MAIPIFYSQTKHEVDQNPFADWAIRNLTYSEAVAYLGGDLAPAPPPFQPTIIFCDGIFGCFTDFFLLKRQNVGIQ